MSVPKSTPVFTPLTKPKPPLGLPPAPPPGPPPGSKPDVPVTYSDRLPPKRSKYAESLTLEVRRQESAKVLKEHPDRIPVILERNPDDKVVPELDRRKFLVPGAATVAGFLTTIRKRIRLTAEQAIFLFVDNTLPPVTMTMSQLYRDFKANDGFVYITFSGESTFGSASLFRGDITFGRDWL